MKEIFEKYASNYDMTDVKIKHKLDHTMHVVEAAKMLGESLNLSDEDKYLAEVVALLHDIGRFEQLKRYDTFSDQNSIDHADFAAILLFEEGLIDMFEIDEKYHQLIKKAITYHNKLSIGEGLNEQELLHAKIIRDADKIDIIESLPYFSQIGMQEVDVAVNEAVMEYIRREETVSYSLIETPNDKLAISFAYVFDINYDEAIRIIYDNRYYEKYYDSLVYKKYFKETFDIVTNYMEKRLNLKEGYYVRSKI